MKRNPFRFFVPLVVIASTVCPLPTRGQPASGVRIRTGTLTLPTYKMGPDEKQPLFRGFQVPGMKVFRGDRSIYPYPKQDNFTNQRERVDYEAITMENEFIKVVILPGLRGRVQGAIDKRNGWDYLYFNHVIKPGDIAVRAGWIAGGLEWNHPGGHGYTQFNRISHRIIENRDGSKTVVVAEIEPVRMMKWEMAITLRPGSLALETEGRFYGIAPYPVPFASSLNGAMHATPGMEMIYPEGTWITGHGKKYIQPWPVYDGVDHRWYRNLRSTYSVFAEASTADFFGCYSHDKNAGTVIVADHRTAPGKKYFSWGAGPAGRRWDTLLSDHDGPYIELQVGAFWDNLGYGYAWLDPLEVKEYTVYWYPVKDLDGFVQANKRICLNLKQAGPGKILLGVEAVHREPGATVRVTAPGRTLLERKLDLDPAKPYITRIDLPPGIPYHEVVVEITGAGGGPLLRYQPRRKRPPRPKLPVPRRAPREATMDQLYRWGKGFYQDPFGTEAEAYFREMLRRDPTDARANRALGLLALHRGQARLARRHLARSLENDPLVGGYRTHYYLGLAALERNDLASAKREFTIASRVARFQVPSLYQLAVVALRAGHDENAARLLREAIHSGGRHPRLWTTLAIACRRLGEERAAAAALEQALARDPLEFTAWLEKWRRGELPEADLHALFDRKDASFLGSQLYIEGALGYAGLGAWPEALQVLELGRRRFAPTGRVYAMLDYYAGYCEQQLGRCARAKEFYRQAAGRRPRYVFPYRPVAIRALRAALRMNPGDAHAGTYLGDVLFYLRRYREANRAWKKSLESHPADPTTLRNLALGQWAVNHDLDQTIALLEKASAADPSDARILMELDYFLDAAGQTQRRAELLASRRATVLGRDELTLSWARLLLRLKEFGKAARIMDRQHFFARENRAGTHAVYAEAHYGLGESRLAAGKPRKALAEFHRALEYPENLGEGAPARVVLVRSRYLEGLAQEALGAPETARKLWRQAADEAVRAGTEGVVYQALALEKLGRRQRAVALLRHLVETCRRCLRRAGADAALCNYVLSRAYAAAGEEAKAATFLKTALAQDPDVVLHARIEAARPPVDGSPRQRAPEHGSWNSPPPLPGPEAAYPAVAFR